MLAELIAHVTNKHVHIATHWDCDGVSSGALLFHLIKQHAHTVTTISKGEEFLIYNRDIHPDADIIICSDIQPSDELDPKKVIYIDHHPFADTSKFLMTIHDTEIQSCSLLIWRDIISHTNEPYHLFLALLGYFGDSGNVDDIPPELYVRANQHFPHLLTTRRGQNGYYTGLQMHVSLFNTGKRMHWNGMVPLELLKQVDSVEDILLNRHPLVDELQRYKLELRRYYTLPVNFIETPLLKYAVIECDKNIQGVICSRHLDDKPIVVINKYKQNGIASMRVPDFLDFDAGAFLSQFREIVPDIVGGGHEKAGGITFPIEKLDLFLAFLENQKVSVSALKD
jgi:single-stranded DNA-specific DHH superfamily exonuclease